MGPSTDRGFTVIVGLTGGIATGKSTVAAILRELGAVVIDADLVSRDVVRPGSEGLVAIVAAFGDSVLTSDGELDRPKLREIVVADPDRRRQLERITHPLIRAEIANRVKDAVLGGASSVFVEAALLVETGGAALYPHLWVVTCAPEVQRHRLMARESCDEETALAWISTQMPLEEKVRHATQVVVNDGDVDQLRRRVSRAFDVLMAQQPDQD